MTPFPRFAMIAFAACSLALQADAATGSDFELPDGLTFENSGIVNMKSDAGAAGDGRTDDTAVFREVFGAGKGNEGRFGEARHIYLPPGEYLVSEPIILGDKKKFIRGAGRDRTIIRLKDATPAFSNPAKPVAVLDTRGEQHFAQNFLQRVIGLTIHTGSGNPGAIALEYHTNNIGGIFGLRLQSGDGAGVAGLGLNTQPGPGLVWDIEVDGFDHGVQATHTLHSMTLANLHLRNQRVAGISAERQSLFIQGVDFEGNVPMLRATNNAYITLTDAVAKGSGDAAVEIDDAQVVIRNLSAGGFKTAVLHGTQRLQGPTIGRFSTSEAVTLFPTRRAVADLQVELPPIPPYEDPAQWVVISPGPEISKEIQAAIDNGARTVFIKPGPGRGEPKEPIILRNNIERIMGFGSVIQSQGDWGQGTPHRNFQANFDSSREASFDKALFRVEDGNAPSVVFEFFHDEYGQANLMIEHASKRPVVALGFGTSYQNTVTGGSLWVIDSVGQPFLLKGQRMFGWQVNTESYNWNPHIENDGGQLYLCGHKIEKDRTNIATINRGHTQLDGGFYYKNRERVGPAPAIVIQDSTFSGGFRTYGQDYPVLIHETQRNVTRKLTHDANGKSSSVLLFEASR